MLRVLRDEEEHVGQANRFLILCICWNRKCGQQTDTDGLPKKSCEQPVFLFLRTKKLGKNMSSSVTLVILQKTKGS